ncbi:hypothetical protein M446_0066 [Methylobacterium sp. 4-46]|uniref:hypothetical protein n=1 Tax=unclassified Methylobacterium TaxID=2615210 RepID=UPI000152DD9F|nr:MULTISPECIES: hypothetical protein [Methylobacterium]ACA14653.1 hypothetical protein M446_0066 [Methylobacterium sp. 4-46]WFT80406.1 hypothetical protein QA634_00335 [Methylobacterium nodulans]
MIRLLKHVLIEFGPDRDAEIDAAVAAILATFPEAQIALAPGLLDDDLLLEVRIPIARMAEWPLVAGRAQPPSSASASASAHDPADPASARPHHLSSE